MRGGGRQRKVRRERNMRGWEDRQTDREYGKRHKIAKANIYLKLPYEIKSSNIIMRYLML